jgi:single-strand DNA-binding protein
MSEGMNRVTLLGNLGVDPELKVAQTGLAILQLRLATNEQQWDKEKQTSTERTEWHDVILFGARAEGLAKVLKRGDQLLVEGALRTTSWEKDGVKRWRTEILAKEIYFAGKKRDGATRPGLASTAMSDAARQGAVKQEADLPF